MKEISKPRSVTVPELEKNIIGSFSMYGPYSELSLVGKSKVNVSHVGRVTYLWRDNVPLLAYSGNLTLETLKDTGGWPNKDLMSRIKKFHKHVDPITMMDYTERLYTIERSLPYNSVSREAAENLVKSVLDNYNVNYVVDFKRLPNMTLGITAVRRVGVYGEGRKYLLCFRERRTLRSTVVLHETAHVLDYHFNRSMGHGPTFIGIYAALLERYDRNPLAAETFENEGLPVAKVNLDEIT